MHKATSERRLNYVKKLTFTFAWLFIYCHTFSQTWLNLTMLEEALVLTALLGDYISATELPAILKR